MGGLKPVSRLIVVLIFLPVMVSIYFLAPATFRVNSPLPEQVVLLWIEEINTHFRPIAQDIPVPDPVKLEISSRQLQLQRIDKFQQGDGQHLLINYRIYDYDLLTASSVYLISSSRLPHMINIPVPSARQDSQLRLAPDYLIVQNLREDQSVTLRVDKRQIHLPVGSVWAEGWIAGTDGPILIVGDEDVFGGRQQIIAALDDGRPVTVLRLKHLDLWNLSGGRSVL